MALTVLLSWKEPGPSAYAEQLLGLTDDRKFRDFLSTLDIEEISMTVKQEHMPALMGMLIRIFYGKIISKHGRNAGKAGLAPRRNAIFAYMVGLGDAERLLMVSLMTRTFDSILPSETITTDNLVGVAEAFEDIPVRQQMGFLMVLESVVKQFKNHLVPLLPRILTVLIPILMSAYKNIDKADEVLEENTEEEVEGLPKLKQQRHLRQQAVRRLTEILESCQQFDYSPFIEPIFTAFLRARLAKLANENNQAPTSILHLLGIWANSRQYARWLVHDANLVSQLFNILSVNGVKDVVVSHILGMIESLMALDELDESTAFADEILAPSTSFLIKNLHTLLGRLVSSKSLYVKTNGRSISDRSIRILARVSRFVSPDMTETLEELGSVLLPFLKKPARQVSERLKMDILEILKFFLPSFASMKSEPLDSAYYSACSNLFKTLQDPACRIKAVEFYEAFLSFDPRVAIVAEQLRDMNSRSTKRLDEPDYERCFNAMDRIRGQLLETLDIKQWLPVVANLLHLLHEQQEFSVRTAAQNGLKKLIEHASKTTENRGDKDLVSMVFNFILPSIKEGIRATQEVVRQEYVALLAAVVELFPSRPEVSDMVILLVDGDDEASFFTNVYHLQNHRRTRALRRLAEVCRAKKISTGNISNIMLPLISHNLFETERRVSNQMLIDTIGCMAAFASCLPWGRYYDLLRTYFRLLVKRPHMQKEIIRLIVAVLDDFHFDLLDAVSLPETELEDKPSSGVSEPPAGKATDQMDVEDPMDVELDDDDTEQDKTAEVELADKKAQRDRIHTVVVKRILPNLFKHLTHKEDEVISVRAPVAIAIVRLLKKLPMDTLTLMLPKLLTTMCQNLRSRMTEVRTSTRSALLEVAAELGPYYFHFVLKELQGALTRGYQLHILGFTVHALLVEISPKFAADSLDPCSELLVEILIGDIFGDVGAEKEVEALAVKMIETRASKSFDSFEILARFTRVQDLERMLQPLKDIMLETNDAAVARKISDVLRRISVGLFHGTREVDVPSLLIFAHGLLNETLPLSKLEKEKTETTESEKRFLVNLDRNDPLDDTLVYFRANAHLFVEFGLSLILTAIKREKISPKVDEHLKMMGPLVDSLARSLYSSHTPVVIVASKTLAYMMKWPLPKLKQTVAVIVKRLFEVISRHSAGTNAELVQSAFRLLSAIMRDCADAKFTNQQVAALIQLVIPELEEPDRQFSPFDLVRAILARKYVLPEVYDLMQIILKLSFVSQSPQIKSICRDCYMRFLTDYPVGLENLRKQVSYILKNLEYTYEAGRLSVLQLVSSIVAKFADDVLFQFSDLILCALVLMLVNDESATCREQCARTIQALLRRLSPQKQDLAFKLLEGWASDPNKVSMHRAAIQVFGLFAEAVGADSSRRFMPRILHHVTAALDVACADVLAQDGDEEDDGADRPDDIDPATLKWEAGYYALSTLARLHRVAPADATAAGAAEVPWRRARRLVGHPHMWVKTQACRVLGDLFATVDPAAVAARRISPAAAAALLDAGGVAARGVAPAAADDRVAALGRDTRRLLLGTLLSEDLAVQVVKNLVFLGRCLLAAEPDAPPPAAANPGDDAAAVPATKSPLLALYRSISFMARGDVGSLRRPLLRRSAFQWLGAMTSFIPPARCGPFLVPALAVLYRASEDTTIKGNPIVEQLPQLAKEVMDVLHRHAGSDAYLAAYNIVTSAVRATRDERRLKRKIEAVADPAATARRKQRKAEKRKEVGKRNAAEAARRRSLGVGGSAYFKKVRTGQPGGGKKDRSVA